MAVEQRDGWFVVNVGAATWVDRPGFGKRVTFEPDGQRFTQLGVNIAILAPGEPASLYHRENAEEDFLVLAGECTLVINGEERAVNQEDFASALTIMQPSTLEWLDIEPPPVMRFVAPLDTLAADDATHYQMPEQQPPEQPVGENQRPPEAILHPQRMPPPRILSPLRVRGGV